jgi:hypothetical protein
MQELGVPQSGVACLWCDNIGATYLTANLVFHARTKYIEIDYYFVKERVAQKLLHIKMISYQIADGFTNALPIRKLVEFRYSLNLGGCD